MSGYFELWGCSFSLDHSPGARHHTGEDACTTKIHAERSAAKQTLAVDLALDSRNCVTARSPRPKSSTDACWAYLAEDVCSNRSSSTTDGYACGFSALHDSIRSLVNLMG